MNNLKNRLRVYKIAILIYKNKMKFRILKLMNLKTSLKLYNNK